MDQAVVKNAADKSQVLKAKDKEKFQRDTEIQDLKKVLSTREGRRFLWRLMAHCKVFESILETSARIYYNSGRQDVGHFLMAEIAVADDEKLFEMMREAKQEELNNV